MKRVLFATLGLCALALADEQEVGPLPETKPSDPAQVELGKKLFFDPRLSGDATLSCASCHDPKKGWSDGLELSKGYPSTLYFRRTPSLMNAVYQKRFYWDGRLDGSDMATLVRDHVSEAHFMNADGRLVIERMRQVPEYEDGFKKAFKGEPTYGRILDAVSAFVKTLKSKNVPFDRFLSGEKEAISPFARRGYEIFKGRANCLSCHSGPLLSDGKFHALGVPENPDILKEPLRHITFRRFFRTLGVPGYEDLRRDLGLFAVTKEDRDVGRFRTPSLREVSRRAPYMHNGSLKTLAEVVDFHDRQGKLGLTAEEKSDLVEFLKSLSGDEIEVGSVELPEYKLRKLGEN